VTLKPKAFFAKAKSEKKISSAFKYLAVVSLVYAAGGYFVSPANVMMSKEALAVLSYVIRLLAPFVSVLIINAIARILGGKGRYNDTYKAVVYSSTPNLLFGWIPLIGVIPSLYALYLSVLGISKYHRISMWKALASVIIFPVLIAAVAAFIIAVLASSLMA
jgi:hypothetical protein